MVDLTVLGVHLGTGAFVGLGAGLLTWMLEDAISTQIQEKQWVLPVLGGLGAAGAYYLWAAS